MSILCLADLEYTGQSAPEAETLCLKRPIEV